MADSVVISFDKDWSFYHNLGMQKLSNSNYPEAAFYLKQAVRREQDSADSSIELAKLYSAVSRFEQSNEIYFRLLSQGKAVGKCYFGLSQNLYYMNDVEHSIYYLNLYTDKYSSEGLFEGDDDGYIEIIDEDDYSGYGIVYPEEKQDKTEDIETARRHMKSGKFDEAARILLSVKEGNADYIFARNNLALCYFFMGDYNLTKHYCNEVLKLDEENIFALCNLAAMYNYIGDSYKSDLYLKKITDIDTDDISDLFKISTTLCELKQHELALKYLLRILKEKPYDNNIMFLTAIAYYNNKLISRAEDFFLQLLKLDEKDYAARYYLDYINEVKRDKDIEKDIFQPLEYICQVPYGEMLERIKTLRELFKKPAAEQKIILSTAKALQLCDWGFDMSDQKFQKIMANKMIAVNSTEIEQFFREKLLDSSIEDEIKKHIVEKFILQKLPPAYSVTVDYAVKTLNPMLSKPGKEEKSFYAAYATAYSHMIGYMSEKLELDLFSAYKTVSKAAIEKGVTVKSKRVAAALITYVSKGAKLKKLRKSICVFFKVQLSEFEEYLSQLDIF